MEYIEVSGKTVDDAITEALIKLETTSDKIEYEVIEEGSTGFLGLRSKPAVIRARKKKTVKEDIEEFLQNVFHAMNMEVEIIFHDSDNENVYLIEFKGNDMGVLIGKRGQTLDSLQYLTNLAINKDADVYLSLIHI